MKLENGLKPPKSLKAYDVFLFFLKNEFHVQLLDVDVALQGNVRVREKKKEKKRTEDWGSTGEWSGALRDADRRDLSRSGKIERERERERERAWIV